MGFERFSIVRVPFPFTDRPAAKNRPARVLSDAATFNTPVGHTVLAMITSQDTTAWPVYCPLQDLAAAGLPAASKRRFKLLKLDNRLIRGELGRLSKADEANVRKAMQALLKFKV